MTQQERMEMYRTYLVEEGYCPQVNGEGSIVFRYEGGTYVVQLDANDEGFFRLIYPNFWPIETESDRFKAAQAALHATCAIKVAKVFFVENNTWATVELFCAQPEVFVAVFRRCLGALQAGVADFLEQVRPRLSKIDDNYGYFPN